MSEFTPAKAYAMGVNSKCRPCFNETRRLSTKGVRTAKRRTDAIIRHRQFLILQHLLKNPCLDCGETDVRVLEFDHVRGTKTTEVALLTVAVGPLSALLEEIAKCEVLCGNCHWLRTQATFGGYRHDAWEDARG